ncbi:MAG: hypothetical protein R3279_01560, partial [Putridiphycobacter sp.]|nr:hypothetical protein [Putridiphycobacter sp.]
MKTKLLFLLFVCTVVVNSASGQNLTITAPETNNFITTTTVPNGTAAQTTLRAHFIIPASELQGIPTGTSIDELGVNIQAVGVGTASGTLQFYLENTSDVTNNKSENWVTAITPMTSVYNGPFAIPAAAGPADFAIASPFTYNGGGLYVAYEYIGSTFATTGSQYWVNTELAGSCKYSSTSTATPADSVNDISSSRPEIRFTFVNPFTNNLEVYEVESDFGVGNSFLTDDLEFTVEVTNIGTQPVNNVPVTLEFIGPVTYTATETV